MDISVENTFAWWICDSGGGVLARGGVFEMWKQLQKSTFSFGYSLFAHKFLEKRTYFVSLVKVFFDASTWLLTEYFFCLFLHNSHKMFVYPENLCVNIECEDVHMKKLIFLIIWNLVFYMYHNRSICTREPKHHLGQVRVAMQQLMWALHIFLNSYASSVHHKEVHIC
jgi:hypothetical protein